MTEEIKEILKEYSEDTKRHFDVVAEEIENKIYYLLLKIALIKIKHLEKRINILEVKINK